MKRNAVENKRPALGPGDEEKKSLVTFEEEKHVYSTGRSNVEVTIKISKKKKDEGKHLRKKDEVKTKTVTLVPATSNQSLRRGSWADLLSQPQPHRHVKGKPKVEVEPKITKVDKQNKGTQVANNDQEDMLRENEFLRRQASTLLEDLNKAKAELKECFTTIKDLRQLSDLLKYENECLTGSKNERLKLEDHLKNVLAENRILKNKIDEVDKMYNQVTVPKDNQIKKLKNAIKEMKSTIDDEIDEMRQKGTSLVGSTLLFQQLDIGSSDEFLSDTKPNQNEGILSSASSMSLRDRDEEGSSTQYMGVPKSSGSGDINPVVNFRKQVLTLTDGTRQKSSHPVMVSEHVKGYSVQPGERNNGKGYGKGDHLNVEHPLKGSQGVIKLPTQITSSHSSEYVSTSSSTVNEYRDRKN